MPLKQLILPHQFPRKSDRMKEGRGPLSLRGIQQISVMRQLGLGPAHGGPELLGPDGLAWQIGHPGADAAQIGMEPRVVG